MRPNGNEAPLVLQRRIPARRLTFSEENRIGCGDVFKHINSSALTFGICYLVLKLLVRSVWYCPEERRPGYIRHFFIIRSLDFAAVMFLCATAFFILNTKGWAATAVVTAGLILWDLLLRGIFLHLEARRLCQHSRHHNMSMRHAKRRLRRRAKQESPF